ncbi:hypothetical protein psal_cds_261 [Pandoravirus salinus]|uniref:Uncharacterized protein n=1 Tax=Pandoravirus salinus TaxID=1349410 RepID=S4VTL8_9VIRU|nr:hypothetical protein psal_cds_261 [Pandoravirus salinus]AGO83829.1 hypothetical protein psal_cds_261 [Pandoravirus salinus]
MRANNRQTAATVAIGAAMGALAGGLFGIVRGKLQRGKAQRGGPDLGHAWPYVRTDHDLCEFIERLSVFRSASAEHYRAVGDACDDMVALMAVVQDHTVPTQALWQTKSFRYVKRVGDALAGLADAVVDARRLAAARLVTENRALRHRGGAAASKSDGGGGGDVVEFETCAGGIYGIVANYHASIARTIATRTGGVRLGDIDAQDDDDDDDEGSDASDLDSDDDDYSKDDDSTEGYDDSDE